METSIIGTVAVLAVLTVIVAAVLISVIKDKKAGRTSCGGNCAHCAMHCNCSSNYSKHRKASEKN